MTCWAFEAGQICVSKIAHLQRNKVRDEDDEQKKTLGDGRKDHRKGMIQDYSRLFKTVQDDHYALDEGEAVPHACDRS